MSNITYRFGPQIEDDRTRFRLWAPGAAAAELVIQGGAAGGMIKTADGFFEAVVEGGAGTR